MSEELAEYKRLAELVSSMIEEIGFRIIIAEYTPIDVSITGLKIEDPYIYLVDFNYCRGISFYWIALAKFKSKDALRMDRRGDVPVKILTPPRSVRNERAVRLHKNPRLVKEDIITLLRKAEEHVEWDNGKLVFRAAVGPFLSFPLWLYNDTLARFLLGGLVVYERGNV